MLRYSKKGCSNLLMLLLCSAFAFALYYFTDLNRKSRLVSIAIEREA